MWGKTGNKIVCTAMNHTKIGGGFTHWLLITHLLQTDNSQVFSHSGVANYSV